MKNNVCSAIVPVRRNISAAAPRIMTCIKQNYEVTPMFIEDEALRIFIPPADFAAGRGRFGG